LALILYLCLAVQLVEIQEVRRGLKHADFLPHAKYCEGRDGQAFTLLYGKDFRLKVYTSIHCPPPPNSNIFFVSLRHFAPIALSCNKA
jgi:hypothetical protein